jgi:hypothetical protein
VDTWLDRRRGADVPGVHLGTFPENQTAIHFFEGCGLLRHGVPQRVRGVRTRDGQCLHVKWMVRATGPFRASM